MSVTSSSGSAGSGTAGAGATGPKVPSSPLSEEEFLSIVREAHVIEAERVITELETELAQLKKLNSTTTVAEEESVVEDVPVRAASERSISASISASVSASGDAAEDGSTLREGGLLNRQSSFEQDQNEEEQENDEEDILNDNYAIEMENIDLNSPTSSTPTGAGKDTRVLTLTRIGLHAKAGQLISIVGPVGSGKSSLLSALLGDMRCVSLIKMKLSKNFIGVENFMLSSQ